MTVVDSSSPSMLAAFRQFASTLTYVSADKTKIGTVRGFARGVREDDLFAEAMQQDITVIIDAPAFVAEMGADTPRKLDRVRLPSGTYAVEVWRASPASGVPVFFKLLVRGGQQ